MSQLLKNEILIFQFVNNKVTFFVDERYFYCISSFIKTKYIIWRHTNASIFYHRRKELQRSERGIERERQDGRRGGFKLSSSSAKIAAALHDHPGGMSLHNLGPANDAGDGVMAR
ncbi:hypothetical protein NE237_032697 [Protea cynaroides]|uniref:Uncharacterized protein n=1 Tax=Protea cynaroides TaxID=273540 RepID=A0A9Q0L426_9MAGN|nr:hypothetical protein NE237_032697 [Protea cynaroides]